MINMLVGYLIFNNIRNVNLNYCEIKGNVKNPGVYLIDNGDVINDIILKAGGLKKGSYTRNINLSKKVKDEMVIYIFSTSEIESFIYVCPVCNCNNQCKNDITTTTNARNTTKINFSETTTAEKTTEATTFTTSFIPVNINTATLEELMSIPGIGGVLAENIINYRNEHLFLKIEDILEVKGVGEKLFNKIKGYIKV